MMETATKFEESKRECKREEKVLLPLQEHPPNPIKSDLYADVSAGVIRLSERLKRYR